MQPKPDQAIRLNNEKLLSRKQNIGGHGMCSWEVDDKRRSSRSGFLVPPERRDAGGATRKNRAGPVSLYSRSLHKCPSHRDGVLWGDPATAGTGRFFQTVGQAAATDVTQAQQGRQAQRLTPKGAAWPGS
jgi:hypothetical protein